MCIDNHVYISYIRIYVYIMLYIYYIYVYIYNVIYILYIRIYICIQVSQVFQLKQVDPSLAEHQVQGEDVAVLHQPELHVQRRPGLKPISQVFAQRQWFTEDIQLLKPIVKISLIDIIILQEARKRLAMGPIVKLVKYFQPFFLQFCIFQVNRGKNMHTFYQLGKKYSFSPLFYPLSIIFFPKLVFGHIFDNNNKINQL